MTTNKDFKGVSIDVCADGRYVMVIFGVNGGAVKARLSVQNAELLSTSIAEVAQSVRANTATALSLVGRDGGDTHG